MFSSLLSFLKYSPVYFCIVSAVVYLLLKLSKKEKHTLESVFIVGMSASCIPAGLMLIYAAVYDMTIIQTFTEMFTYIALCGLGLIYVSLATVVEKFRS